MNNRLLGCVLSLSMAAMPLVALADGFNSPYGGQLQPLNTYTYQSNGNAYNAYSNGYVAQSHEPIALRGGVSTIPQGTTMLVRLAQPISSYANTLGESIGATLENDILVNNAVAVPAGSEVYGQVTNVSRSSRLGRHGEVDVRFHSIKTPMGSVIPISGHVVTKDDTGILRGNSYKMDIAKGLGIAAGATGIGAVAGTAMGGLLGVAGTGAVFGTAVGGLAGMTYALARKGKDVVIPTGTRMSVMVDHDGSVGN